jgi:hypothetical protein
MSIAEGGEVCSHDPPMLVVALATLAAALVAPVVARPPSPSPTLAAADVDAALLARLADGAARARARYLEGDFDGAIAAAADVEDAFVGASVAGCAGPDCVRDGAAFGTDARAWDAWADAQATRALAAQRLGDAAGMDAIFRGIVAARPTWQLDRGFVPPREQQRFEELRLGLLSTAMAPLTVRVDGIGEVLLDGRVVPRDAPIDVIPGRHFVGVAGRGRVVVVEQAATVALVGPPAPARTLADPPAAVVPDDGPPWGLIVGGAVGVVVVTGVVVGVAVALNQPEAPSNPGGVTVVVDASRLNRAAP